MLYEITHDGPVLMEPICVWEGKGVHLTSVDDVGTGNKEEGFPSGRLRGLKLAHLVGGKDRRNLWEG